MFLTREEGRSGPGLGLRFYKVIACITPEQGFPGKKSRENHFFYRDGKITVDVVLLWQITDIFAVILRISFKKIIDRA